MRILSFFPIFILAFLFTSCNIEDDSPDQEVKTELISAIIGPCEGEPIYVSPGYGEGNHFPSMQIKFEDDEWETYPTYYIRNFEFEPGFEYKLSIEKTTTRYIKNIPMDGSNPSVDFNLKETVSKNPKECE